ncbi:MAG: S8 family serine peptidase [Anaerolineales bacterium]|nr:S8 family serine peptidase [Anaerolineales bacterium]
MKKHHKIIQILLALMIVIGLLGPVSIPTKVATASLQPALAQIVKETPDAMVRVIVQKADDTDRAEQFVESLGGKVLKELELIHSFAALVPGKAVPRLAKFAAVNWVSLDSPVRSTAQTKGTVYFDTLQVADPAAEVPDDSSTADGDLQSVVIVDEGTLPVVDESFTKVAEPLPIVAKPFPIVVEPLPIVVEPIPVVELKDYDPVEMKYVADDFEGVPYTFDNNSGTRNWAGGWLEGGEEDGPAAGSIQVISHDADGGQAMQLSGNGLSITRSVDLSNISYAKFYFGVQRLGFEAKDYLAVEISGDGGITWAELGRLQGLPQTSLAAESAGFAIGSEYASSNTTIRFITVFEDGDQDDILILDNIRILFDSVIVTLPEIPRNTYLETLNVPKIWDMGLNGAGITIAVVDSGITNDPDFGGEAALTIARESSSRLLVQEVFSENTKTYQDNFGHGTHVAGIIAGDGFKSKGTYMGVAPMANLISLKVSDDNGMAYESDTVEALQWIFDYKDKYNIRVVNLSIQSTIEQSYHESALDAAIEILWFNNIVVLAAAGNKTEDTDYDPVHAAPANDPFIITVGASNEKGDSNRDNDFIADFSSHTDENDFFIKPEIYAPGKDIISVLASSSWWQNLYPERFIDGGYFRISGTSMSTPMVSGAVALLLQSEPNLTPDQVKYRLLATAGKVGAGNYLDVYAALTTPTKASANQGVMPHMLLAKMAMIAYWASTNGEEAIDWESVDWEAVDWDAVDWDAIDWTAVNWNAVNWNAVNWNAVNWNSVNWNAVNWNAVNWNSVNWNSVNWNSVNWNSVNWNSVNWDE